MPKIEESYFSASVPLPTTNNLNSDEQGGEIERKRQIKLLADYLKRRYEEFKAHSTILASMLGD